MDVISDPKNHMDAVRAVSDDFSAGAVWAVEYLEKLGVISVD